MVVHLKKSKKNDNFIPLLVAFQFFADFPCPLFVSGKTLLFFSPMSVFSNQFDLFESCLFLVSFLMLRQNLQTVGLCVWLSDVSIFSQCIFTFM